MTTILYSVAGTDWIVRQDNMPGNESLSKINLNALTYWRGDRIPALVVGLANKVHWIELAAVPPYLVLLVWMMKKDAGWGSVLLLLTPGIYLILKGVVLLTRYLYLHRVPQT